MELAISKTKDATYIQKALARQTFASSSLNQLKPSFFVCFFGQGYARRIDSDCDGY